MGKNLKMRLSVVASFVIIWYNTTHKTLVVFIYVFISEEEIGQ